MIITFKLIYVDVLGYFGVYKCCICNRHYKNHRSLWAHSKYVCGKQPSFKCPECSYRAWHKHHLKKHMRLKHNLLLDVSLCEPMDNAYTNWF